MEKRRLGSTSIEVSRVGLGSATFGREIDERTSFEIMDHAVEHGINLFDTAEAYGGGQARDSRRLQLQVDDIREVTGEHHSSEKIIGRWLRATGARNQIVLVSKVTTNFNRIHLLEALQASLERLQTDYLDVYLFHSFDAHTPLEEALEAMDGVQRSGLIRFVGCSNFTGAQVRDALRLARHLGLQRLEVVEAICNLAARSAEEDLLPLCREEGLGFLAYSPLGAGFLSGKYTGDRDALPERSRFHVMPAHADIYFTPRNFEILKELQTSAALLDVPAVKLAMGWVFMHPAVTSVLCGARNTSHLDNAISAYQLRVPPDWQWPAELRPPAISAEGT